MSPHLRDDKRVPFPRCKNVVTPGALAHAFASTITYSEPSASFQRRQPRLAGKAGLSQSRQDPKNCSQSCRQDASRLRSWREKTETPVQSRRRWDRIYELDHLDSAVTQLNHYPTRPPNPVQKFSRRRTSAHSNHNHLLPPFLPERNALFLSLEMRDEPARQLPQFLAFTVAERAIIRRNLNRCSNHL